MNTEKDVFVREMNDWLLEHFKIKKSIASNCIDLRLKALRPAFSFFDQN